jgi:hypothetical protein
MDKLTRKRMLEWYLRFINKDLNQLDLGEKMKLIGDAVTIISGRGAELFSAEAPAHLTFVFDKDDESKVMPNPWGDKKALENAVADWLKEDKLSICQERLKTFFDSLINNFRLNIVQIAKNENLRSESTSTTLLGQETLDKITILLGMPIDQEVLEIDRLSETDQMSVEDTEFLTLEREETVIDSARSQDFDTDLFEFDDDTIKPYVVAFKNTPIELSYKGSIEGETLQLYFCIALEDAYFGSFKKCIECGTLFVHTSKRKRLFCTPQCAMRKANRDKRKSIKEHDPVEYKKELAEGKKRAKKSYRKRTKK